MDKVPVKVVRLRPEKDLPLPPYQTEFAAGMDLVADLDADLILKPLERFAVPTGLSLEIPPGYEGQIRPRSGLSLKHGLTCLNSPGTIDADYRGEVKVILANLSNEPFVVRPRERIAQLVLARVTQAEWVEASDLSKTSRGQGGFGSTGRQG